MQTPQLHLQLCIRHRQPCPPRLQQEVGFLEIEAGVASAGCVDPYHRRVLVELVGPQQRLARGDEVLAPEQQQTQVEQGTGIARVQPDRGRISLLRFFFGAGLGTDTGGFNESPGPRPDASQHPLRYPFRSYDGNVTFVCQISGTRRYDLNKDGVAHYGLYADLIGDMQRQRRSRKALRPFFRSAEAYLEMWQRAYGRG